MIKNSKIKLYKTIMLPVVLYCCETWSLTLREECRIRLFENRILRPIFGPKRDTNGEWRRLQNEELHSLYRSPDIVRIIKSRRLRQGGHVARMEEGSRISNILIGKRPLRRLTRRCEGNIRMGIKEIFSRGKFEPEPGFEQWIPRSLA